jgi:hypothetical protein
VVVVVVVVVVGVEREEEPRVRTVGSCDLQLFSGPGSVPVDQYGHFD